MLQVAVQHQGDKGLCIVVEGSDVWGSPGGLEDAKGPDQLRLHVEELAIRKALKELRRTPGEAVGEATTGTLGESPVGATPAMKDSNDFMEEEQKKVRIVQGRHGGLRRKAGAQIAFMEGQLVRVGKAQVWQGLGAFSGLDQNSRKRQERGMDKQTGEAEVAAHAESLSRDANPFWEVSTG